MQLYYDGGITKTLTKQHKQLKIKMKSSNEHVHSTNCRNIVNMKIYLYTPYLFIAKMKPRGEPASNKK
jgi:L-lactate utilization protein LutB